MKFLRCIRQANFGVQSGPAGQQHAGKPRGVIAWPHMGMHAGGLLLAALFLLAGLRPAQAQSTDSADKADWGGPELIEVVVPSADPVESDLSLTPVQVPQAETGRRAEVNAPANDGELDAVMDRSKQAATARGLLPQAGDRHYFGLKPIQPQSAFAVTLAVEPAEALAGGDGVNFVVLTEGGLKAFLAGADPMDVKLAKGQPLLFDQAGNRLTALVPGGQSSGYTVIVYSDAPRAATYTLEVQGAVLRDDAGQTLATVDVSPQESAQESAGSALMGPAVESAAQATGAPTVVPAQLAEMMELGGDLPAGRLDLAPGGEPAQTATVLLPKDAVRARRISGQLSPATGRHYYELVAGEAGQDVTLMLHLPEAGAAPSMNFWVMTQDGVRHLVRGGWPQELNLATGHYVTDVQAGQPGATYQARLRIAPNVVYTVVVFSDSGRAMDYTLRVQGGVLMDPYGQSREAQAAALEVLALNQEKE